MIILHIETSTHVCSVALSEDENLIFSRLNTEGRNHATLLSVFIEEAFRFLQTENKKPDAVAVSSGPGSYTGLRIGVSTAKGLCYGLSIPLISIDTLEIMFLAAKKLTDNCESSVFIPMIDARRMEVFDAVYNSFGTVLRKTKANIIDENSFSEFSDNEKIYIFGNGAEKCLPIISVTNTEFLKDINPLAENMIIPACKKYRDNKFEDVAYFEPFYLKEFFTIRTFPLQPEFRYS